MPNLYFMTLGYNTKLVAAHEVPKSLNDLLNPKWEGKMIWNTSGGYGAPVFIGNTLITSGEQKGMGYLKLAAQKVGRSTTSARAVMDMVIAERIRHRHQYVQLPRGYQPGRRRAR